MKETVTIHDIVKILKKRWKIIFLMTLLAGLIGGFFTFYVITPKYQASSQILVNQKGSDIDSPRQLSNVEIINTYGVIIKSPVILEKVIKTLKLNLSVKELTNRITVNSQEDSLVFSLTVEDSQPQRAVNIVNEISDTFQREINGIMNVDNVSILARAENEINPAPIGPNPAFNISIGILIGIIGGLAISLLLELLDNSLKDAKDVEECLELPVLGSIQKLPQKHSEKNTNVYQREGETIEA